MAKYVAFLRPIKELIYWGKFIWSKIAAIHGHRVCVCVLLLYAHVCSSILIVQFLCMCDRFRDNSCCTNRKPQANNLVHPCLKKKQNRVVGNQQKGKWDRSPCENARGDLWECPRPGHKTVSSEREYSRTDLVNRKLPGHAVLSGQGKFSHCSAAGLFKNVHRKVRQAGRQAGRLAGRLLCRVSLCSEKLNAI